MSQGHGKVLGLDVSTSIVGITVLDKDDGSICELAHIDLRKGRDLFEKGTWVEAELRNLVGRHPDIDALYIEDAAKKFTSGRSSATVIATLMRFNGIASFVAYNVFKLAPIYVAPTTARRLCGLKMQQSKKCGKSHKQQTFDMIMESDLSHITWPTKQRSENIVDWAYDTVDSYVIAKAGVALEQGA
jgi:hypothetical protein